MSADTRPASFRQIFTEQVLDLRLEEVLKKVPLKDDQKDTLASAADSKQKEPASQQTPLHDPAAIKRYLQLTELQQKEWNDGIELFQQFHPSKRWYPSETDKLEKTIATVEDALVMLKNKYDIKGIMWNLAGNFSSAQMHGFEDQAKESLESFTLTLEIYLKYMKFALEHEEAERFALFSEKKPLSVLKLEAVFRTLSPHTKTLLLGDLKEDIFLSQFEESLPKVVESYPKRYADLRSKLEQPAATIAKGFIDAEEQRIRDMCVLL